MGRVIFSDNTQADFLKNVQVTSRFSINKLANLCKVSERTFRDWLRGKYTISEKSLFLLIDKFKLPIPRNIHLLDDYWYVKKGAKKGALKRLELYGPLGTPEGRRKGGIISQIRRRENPNKYRLLGCKVRKTFKNLTPSIELAEVAGIILGDGGITDYQLRITVSSIVDKPYADFVSSLFQKVFNEKPSITQSKSDNSLNITLSGASLVEKLEKWGFIKGDKVKHQVEFPEWIWKNLDFQKACVRGLMDTDGGCYFHKHRTNGLVYRNFGVSFANQSLPIVESVAKVLKSLGLKFSVTNRGTRIYIYSIEEIKKYFKLIGSHNLKNNKKLEYYLSQKTHRVGCESGLITDPGKIVWA